MQQRLCVVSTKGRGTGDEELPLSAPLFHGSTVADHCGFRYEQQGALLRKKSFCKETSLLLRVLVTRDTRPGQLTDLVQLGIRLEWQDLRRGLVKGRSTEHVCRENDSEMAEVPDGCPRPQTLDHDLSSTHTNGEPSEELFSKSFIPNRPTNRGFGHRRSQHVKFSGIP